MHIAIIDDEYAGRSELRYFISQYLPEAVFVEADSGKKAVEIFQHNTFDAAFLDMALGDLMGNKLAKLLRNIQPDVKFVFATAHDSFAIQAFDIGVLDYLVKPFDPQRVEQCVGKLKQAIRWTAAEQNPPRNKLVVPVEESTLLLDIDTILFLETENRHCMIHTVSENHLSTQPLGYYEKRLESYSFYRTHKSYLVNLDHVSELVPWFNGAYTIKLRGTDHYSIPVSRGYMRQLRELLGL